MVLNIYSGAVCVEATYKITDFSLVSASKTYCLIIVFNYYRIIHVLLLNILYTGLLRILSLNCLSIDSWKVVAVPWQNANVIKILCNSRYIEIIIGVIYHLLVVIGLQIILVVVASTSIINTLKAVVHIGSWLEVLLGLSDNHALICTFFITFEFVLTSFRICSAVHIWHHFLLLFHHLLQLRIVALLLAYNQISLATCRDLTSSLKLYLRWCLVILIHLCLSDLLLLYRIISSNARVQFSIFWISKLRNLIWINIARKYFLVIKNLWWILRARLTCSTSMASSWYLLLNLKLFHNFVLTYLNLIWNLVLSSWHGMFLIYFFSTS